MHPDSGCFQPARGVIHPSFPLRGRWGRSASVGEQAPSPSLAFFCKTSLGMHPTSLLCKLFASPHGPSPSDKSLRIRRSRSRPRPPFISLIPKGATSRGTPSRLGKNLYAAVLRLVLTNQKYLHRPDHLPIPSRPSQNQYLWNDQISEASESRREPAPGGLLRLDSRSNRHPLLRASALQPAEVYLRMRKRLSGPGVCSSLQLAAMPPRATGPFLPAHSPEPQLSHLLGSPCAVASRPLTQEQSNSTRLTLAFLDDSGCRKASAEHMMGVPQ